MIAALALASCSQDELADNGQGTLLPYGKYPLELTATIGKAVATPATRGTVHGTWDDEYPQLLKMASSIEYPDEDEIDWFTMYQNIKQLDYKIKADGTLELTPYVYDPIYWRRSDEKIYIYAFCWNTTPDERNPNPHAIFEDQRKAVAFNQSDFLVAYAALTFHGNHTLTFRHLPSKVTINLMQSDYLDAQGSEGVEVKLTTDNKQWYVEGKFKGRKLDDVTLFEAEGLKQSEIIPYKNPNQTDGIYATYEAVVIPQKITSTGKTIEIKVGETTYSYEVECSKGQYTSGEEWIYNITVDAKGLNVTVKEGNIGWGTDGASGSGEVELS